MRDLPDTLETALGDGRRRPAYKILAFDPALDNLGAIVKGEYSQAPMDLTPYCADIAWTPAQLSFTLADPAGIFHPDTGEQKQYLADKAVIRLKEGDARVDEADWVWTFTGQIRGQSGWQKARRSQTLESKVTAFSRENSQGYKRRQITSKEYTVGTEIGVFLYDLAGTFMGLSPEEIRIPPVLGLQLQHKVNQIAQMTPWDAVSAILETVGRVPYFDGDGRLTSINKDMNRLPDRVLPDYIRVFDYQIPARNQDNINKIRVTFLDSALSRVDSPFQKLGQAQVTTGFFSRHEKLPCWWSEDHKQRADGTEMKVIKSVNSGILPVGTERYTQVDEFHGEIDIDISVWVPILASVMLMAYLAAAYKPDSTTAESTGYCLVECPPMGGLAVGEVYASETPGTGWTVPVGRIVQAVAMVGIMLIQMSMGSAQYEIWGTPYDYAYLEQESIAIEDGLAYWEENERQIKNDFLGTYEQADSLAVLELIWEKSNSYPRRLLLEDDLALEMGDILALLDGRKFLITGMQKSIKRGEIPLLTLDGFKVMDA
jgi:hypothetical protein